MKIVRKLLVWGLLIFGCLSQVNALDVVFGASSKQGYRDEMEDAHFMYLSQDKKFFSCGVCDGHGGDKTATYAAEHILSEIMKQATFASDKPLAIEKAFKAVDDYCCKNFEDGSTAVVALLDKDTVVLANTGDSRAVVSHGDEIIETFDHKANLPGEQERIENAGGLVVCNGYTQYKPYVYLPDWSSGLGTSRALGDKQFKKDFKNELNTDYTSWLLTCNPDIQSIPVKPGDFMILACDGLWDVMYNDDAVNFVKNQMNKAGFTSQSITSDNAEFIAQQLVKKAITGRVDEEDEEIESSGDNVTVVLVFFK